MRSRQKLSHYYLYVYAKKCIQMMCKFGISPSHRWRYSNSRSLLLSGAITSSGPELSDAARLVIGWSRSRKRHVLDTVLWRVPPTQMTKRIKLHLESPWSCCRSDEMEEIKKRWLDLPELLCCFVLCCCSVVTRKTFHAAFLFLVIHNVGKCAVHVKTCKILSSGEIHLIRIWNLSASIETQMHKAIITFCIHTQNYQS